MRECLLGVHPSLHRQHSERMTPQVAFLRFSGRFAAVESERRHVAQERFKYLLEDYIRMCKNQNISPDVHATYLRLHILQRELSSTCSQRLEFARNEAECNPESLQRWIKEHVIPDPVAAKRKAVATAFIMGNIGVEETSRFGIAAAASFGMSADGADEKFHPENRIVKLKRLTLIQVSTVIVNNPPVGSLPTPLRTCGSLCLWNHVYAELLQATAQNKQEESSAVEYYFQLGPDTIASADGAQAALRTLGLLDLMSQLISEPAFDVLRTKEQLGYRSVAPVSPIELLLLYGLIRRANT
jgi:hypothetical protein